MTNESLGKKAEHKIQEWLDSPGTGYSFDRLYDQMNGFYGSKNICDFICYKYPNEYYIESKSTYEDRFDFSMISDNQLNGVSDKSEIKGVYGLLIVLFASHQRAFVFHMKDIREALSNQIKSLNIKKIQKWSIPYKEMRTIPSRKTLLDYTGDIEEYIP